MRAGRSTSIKPKISKRGHNLNEPIRRDAIYRVMFNIVLDASASASARAAAARTLLDELNRRGNLTEVPLSDMTLADMEREALASPAVPNGGEPSIKPNDIKGLGE